MIELLCTDYNKKATSIHYYFGNAVLVMKHLGVTKEAGHFDRIKWGCPKMQYSKGQWHWLCKNPCSTARKGRTAHTSENMRFRRFPYAKAVLNESSHK